MLNTSLQAEKILHWTTRGLVSYWGKHFRITGVPAVLAKYRLRKQLLIARPLDFKIPCRHESPPVNSLVGENQQKTRLSAGQFP
jgi:hypothetical protein